MINEVKAQIGETLRISGRLMKSGADVQVAVVKEGAKLVEAACDSYRTGSPDPLVNEGKRAINQATEAAKTAASFLAFEINPLSILKK